MRAFITGAMLCCTALLVTGCGSQTASLPTGTTAAGPQAMAVSPAFKTATATVPPAFRCLPSGLPAAATAFNPSLAYMANCAVASAPEAVKLQKLAAALMASGGSAFSEYCTGTPIHYDPATGVGFIVTAAHCVVGNAKAADTPVTADNITTFASGSDWVYQGTPGIVSSEADLTGQIQAVYIPSQYCKVPAFDKGGCSDLARQDGDVAVVKMVGIHGHALDVDPGLRLAPKDAVLASGDEIMALGYGTNTSSTPDDRVLYYITYNYYGTDQHDGVSSQLSLLNGYHLNGKYYSIICQGDSGGGDFYWDGTQWSLIGAHSFGPVPCGVYGATYDRAHDISADTRPWERWIARIVADDKDRSGCGPLNAETVCKAR